MKRLLSVFDFTGNWASPYLDQGADVWTMDLKTGQDALEFNVEYFMEQVGLESVDGLLLAPPCTDFTSAAAWTWKRKDLDGTTAASVEIALQGLRAVELFRPDFWALENPVGRISKLVPELGKPRLAFDPCDFAGWVKLSDEEDARLAELATYFSQGIPFTKADLELVKKSNRYTKRTQLWGDFQMPEQRRVEPIKVCAQGSWLQMLGGKSEATKAARSATPMGFAEAFADANDWTRPESLARHEMHQVALYLRSLDMTPEDPGLLELVEDEFGPELATAETLAHFQKTF